LSFDSSFKNNQDCHVSQGHNNFSEFQHAIGSDANCCSFGSEVCGSDAASSSNLYHTHHQSNSEILTSFIEKDSHTTSNLPSVDGCESLNSIENILTSIESMFKPSLLDLANSHGVKCNTKMSSEELKNVLSDHLCGGCCFSSTYEGCIQITSMLSKKNYEDDHVDRFDVSALLYHTCYLKLNYDLFVDFYLNIMFPFQHRTICHVFDGNLKLLSKH
jgi:hypothetical protein